MIGTPTQIEREYITAQREARREAQARFCPVDVPTPPRFTYRVERVEGFLLTRRRITWTDGLTGAEASFKDGDWAGAGEWRKSQECRS